jgi:hypothetical protein
LAKRRRIVGKIDMVRVILGGLVAGLVINAFENVVNGAVLADQWVCKARCHAKRSPDFCGRVADNDT